jgi:HAD superfamily hydrolase (TIGR01490 family)
VITGGNSLTLAIFDLDNTLLAGDSDHAWGQYLVSINAVDGNAFKLANDQFYEDYQQGRLDIMEYLAFALKPLTEHPMEQLLRWRETFFEHCIKPIILPKGQTLIENHKKQNDDLLIITATNEFVTRPIADFLGIETLLATLPEQINGKYTGRVTGTPCFQEGKITRLNEWLNANNKNLEGACFYSDSHNDLPLLHKVDKPVAVNPDPMLLKEAQQNSWDILDLREE